MLQPRRRSFLNGFGLPACGRTGRLGLHRSMLPDCSSLDTSPDHPTARSLSLASARFGQGCIDSLCKVPANRRPCPVVIMRSSFRARSATDAARRPVILSRSCLPLPSTESQYITISLSSTEDGHISQSIQSVVRPSANLVPVHKPVIKTRGVMADWISPLWQCLVVNVPSNFENSTGGHRFFALPQNIDSNTVTRMSSNAMATVSKIKSDARSAADSAAIAASEARKIKKNFWSGGKLNLSQVVICYTKVRCLVQQRSES